MMEDGSYDLYVDARLGSSEGSGSWLQVAVGSDIFYDDLYEGNAIRLELKEGSNIIRLMNYIMHDNQSPKAPVEEEPSIVGKYFDLWNKHFG